MKGIITVVGKDRVGIIAKISGELADQSVNVLNISQTIVDGYFNMMMIVDMTNATCEFTTLTNALEMVGEEVGVIVKLQHEGIFNAMHRL